MTTALRISPAPVGQQAPPARAAPSDSGRSLRVARGSLLLTKATQTNKRSNFQGSPLPLSAGTRG